LFHSDCSNSEVGAESGRKLRPLSRYICIGALAVVLGAAPVRIAWAQTPTTPPSDSSQQPGQSQPSDQQPGQQQQPQQQQQQLQQQQAAPTPPELEQAPLQQFQIQPPGRAWNTPATPAPTTIPPWTPPVPPPPSLTNVPVPLPFGAGAPGAAAAGAFAGVPGLTIPGAFAPTVLSLRGGTLEFHPTLRVAEEYSDNFFETSSHAQDNFRSILGPGFTLLLKGARTFGTVFTTVDLVHDTAPNSGDEVKVFPSLNAAIRYALTPRLSLTLSDTFVRNDSATTLSPSGIRTGRQTFDANTAGVAVDYLLDQVALQAYYRNALFFNEGSPNTATGTNAVTSTTTGTTQNNTVTNIVGLNGTTRIATDYLVRAGYEFSATNVTGGNASTDGTTTGNNISNTGFASFSRLFGLYASGGVTTSYQHQSLNNTNIYNASLFGAYGLPTGLSLSALVGYSILNSDTQSNTGTIAANANVSYRFARAAVSVGVLQDFVQTAQTGQNFGTVETRSYYGSFLYQITPFINATLNANYTENSPTGTGNVQGAGTQTILTYGAGVNWQLLRWLVARLQYTHIKSTGLNTFNETTSPVNPGTAGTGGNFSENRATLGLYATF
jgi:hypothetical protein